MRVDTRVKGELSEVEHSPDAMFFVAKTGKRCSHSRNSRYSGMDILFLKNSSLRREYSVMREEDKYSVLSWKRQFKSVECVDAFNTIKR